MKPTEIRLAVDFFNLLPELHGHMASGETIQFWAGQTEDVGCQQVVIVKKE